MTRFMLKWEIDQENDSLLIKDFLKKEGISKAALTDIKFQGGLITVNDEEVNVRYKLCLKDVLTVFFPPEHPSDGMKAEEIPLNILYEDESILVINKPAGMSTIPSREHPYRSLANALIGYYQRIGLMATSHIVTRLDRDTSGIVLVAKHRHIHHLLSEEQKRGRINRTYEAFVEGELLNKSGTIEAPIARKTTSIIEREVNPFGQYACTHYRIITANSKLSHLELVLETGRTHQIRVHLSYLGHPLLGDELYGGSRVLINRQALHCSKLSFRHPIYQREMTFEVTLPKDMAELLDR